MDTLVEGRDQDQPVMSKEKASLSLESSVLWVKVEAHGVTRTLASPWVASSLLESQVYLGERGHFRAEREPT